MIAPAPAFAAALAAAAHPYIERHLPAPLLVEGPRGLLWWQWLALPVLVALALAAGSLLGWATRRVLGHLAARTTTTWDDTLVDRVGPPLSVLWAIAVFTLLRPALDLDPEAGEVLSHVQRAARWPSTRRLTRPRSEPAASASATRTGSASHCHQSRPRGPSARSGAGRWRSKNGCAAAARAAASAGTGGIIGREDSARRGPAAG